jgi:hypothetical protein
MTYGVAFGVGAALVLAIIAGVRWLIIRAQHKIAADLVVREMTKTMNAAEDKIRHLPDPERPFSEKEVVDALRKIRDRGRAPK